MAKNRVIFQSLGLYVSTGSLVTGYNFSSGNSGTNFVEQLQRVQTTNFSLDVSRLDINQFGQLAAISREIVDQPSVSLDGSYYIADLSNEKKLGFYVSGNASAITNFLTKTSDEHNYFLEVAPEGVNVFGWTGQSQVFQITNAGLTSYSVEASVGAIPTANFTVEGLNYAANTGSINQQMAAVNPVNGATVDGVLFTLPVGTSGTVGSVAALRPGDITVDISNAAIGFSISDLKIQSFNISFDLARENLNKLGSRFAFAKEISFPVTVSASVTADFGDLATGSLAGILCNDQSYDLRLTMADPACVGSGPIAAQYTLKGVKIDSQEVSTDIGSNASLTINYSVQLGASSDVNGLYMSGKV